jgi:hypothetical protein
MMGLFLLYLLYLYAQGLKLHFLDSLCVSLPVIDFDLFPKAMNEAYLQL